MELDVLKVLNPNAPLEDDNDEDDDFLPSTNYRNPNLTKSGRKKIVVKKRAVHENKENELRAALEAHWSSKVQHSAVTRVLSRRSHNMVHCLQNICHGSRVPPWQSQSLSCPVINNVVKNLKVSRVYRGFDRRVTALAWHPVDPNVVAVGSKGGDIILWNYQMDGDKPRVFIQGRGPGGSIQKLLFDEQGSGLQAYTVSIDGTMTVHDFLMKTAEPYLETGDWEKWYTSLDISFPGRVIVVGDNKGYVTQLTLDGETLWKEKLHNQKVTHIEFSPRAPWCIVTASTDRTVKVWDVRNMKGKKTCLHTLPHEKPVNAAHFSRTDGGKLLTTDQHSQIRVYDCPSFGSEIIIPHPHRQFQHLTPIRATWHPLRDIVVVGRYPDPAFPSFVEGEPRTVDFFDGASGKLLHQHLDRGVGKNIISLNLFNATGDRMLSGAGTDVWIWEPNFDEVKRREERRENSLNDETDYDCSDDDNEKLDKKRKKRKDDNLNKKRSTKKKDDIDDIKKKIKKTENFKNGKSKKR